MVRHRVGYAEVQTEEPFTKKISSGLLEKYLNLYSWGRFSSYTILIIFLFVELKLFLDNGSDFNPGGLYDLTVIIGFHICDDLTNKRFLQKSAFHLENNTDKRSSEPFRLYILTSTLVSFLLLLGHLILLTTGDILWPFAIWSLAVFLFLIGVLEIVSSVDKDYEVKYEDQSSRSLIYVVMVIFLFLLILYVI